MAIRPEAADFHANLAEVLRILTRSDQARRARAQGGWCLIPLYRTPGTRSDFWRTNKRVTAKPRPRISKLCGFGPSTRRRISTWAPHCWRWAASMKPPLRCGRRFGSSLRTLRPSQIWRRSCLNRGTSTALDQAEELCRRALAVAPELTEAINSLGNVCRLQCRLEDAMSWYRRALSLDPRRAAPCQNIGKLLQQCGKYDEAAGWFERAAALKNDPARYHANFGSLWAARQQFDESARCFRLALAHDPESAEAHQGLGDALLEQGQLDLAESCFHSAMELKPFLPFPWISLARLHAQRGEFELSCQEARQALARRPKLPDAYLQLARNLGGQLPVADFAAMEELLRQRYQPDDMRSLLLFSLAGILDAQGDHDRAAAKLETANALQSLVAGCPGSGRSTRPALTLHRPDHRRIYS